MSRPQLIAGNDLAAPPCQFPDGRQTAGSSREVLTTRSLLPEWIPVGIHARQLSRSLTRLGHWERLNGTFWVGIR